MKIERSDLRLGLRMISMSQQQYVEEILERHGMTNCNLAKTPIGNDIQLPILNEAEVDIIKYQRYIGSLIYLMICTQSDIAYSIGVFSCYVSCPGKVHMQAVK